MSLQALAAAVDQLFDDGPERCSDAASLEALHRELTRLDAFLTAAAGAFDTSGRWADDGARNATSWMTARLRVPRPQARRRTRLAGELAHLPESAAAFARGEITAAHVEVIASLRSPRTEEELARDEGLLAAEAGSLRFRDFVRAAAYWRQLADPDGTEQAAERLLERRNVTLVESFDGLWLGQMTLDPISGAIVAGELARLERAMFEADRSEACQRLGREPLVTELGRTAAQRRADALVEMATRSAAAPADGRRPVPLFSVLVGYETLEGRICELANGMPVSPGSLLRWLEHADIERAVFDPPRRVEIGERTRLFGGATRRAIELRDRRCTHAYCDRLVTECEVDHIVPYSEGGLTTQENGRLLCKFHNLIRTRRPPPAA